MRKMNIFWLLSLLVLSSCVSDEFNDVSLNKQSVNLNNDIHKTTQLITLKSGVVVEKIDGKYIYLGDIILSDQQFRLLDETGSMFPDESKLELDFDRIHMPQNSVPALPQAGVMAYPKVGMTTQAVGRSPQQNMFWSMMRFTFGSNLNEWQKQQILDAMAYMESETNIRFYNATGQPTRDPKWGFDYPYVEFVASQFNQSQVGRIGGKQILEISDFFSRGVIVHEICHALGLFHEQCRADRDNYVTVHYSNMPSTAHHNFRVENKNYFMLGGFDFNSIMLYDSYSFSNNGLPTMTKKDGSTFTSNLYGLSDTDKRFINRFYLPYIARPDVCVELDKIVFDENNVPLSEEAREDLERRLNINRCNYPLP